MLLGGAILFALWDWAAWAVHIPGHWIAVPEFVFLRQDMPVLAAYAVVLAAMIPIPGRRGGALMPGWTPPGRVIALACLAIVLLGRIGRSLVFHDHSVSRDEVMVELAGAYLADGRIGWPVPDQWLLYARAMMPEFYSPYGADHVWTSIYLPVHAAIRALFQIAGDADLAAPVTLGVGLWALWDVAGRLFPGRADARAVTMVMALTSVQLLATAMTPYAMTSHFTFNTVWLALVLRGGAAANMLAGMVLILAAGLHQWHFPILFAGPLIVWLLWRRQWVGGLLQATALAVAIILWARVWPLWLSMELGPPAPTSAGGTPGIRTKLFSLVERLDRWQPLLNIGRLVAWNNLLLLPLGALAIGCLPRNWRGWLREPPIVVPLLAIVLIGFAVALYQGYGWGFRYMHGSIGALCLLAGFGWTRLSPEGRRPLTLVWTASALSLAAGLFLLLTTEGYVRGYARTMAAIRASNADVVLLDLRGGYWMNDLARFDEGRPGRPAVMALNHLGVAQIEALCAAHRVAIIDHGQYWALGVHRISPVVREGPALDRLRRTLDRLKCGAPVVR